MRRALAIFAIVLLLLAGLSGGALYYLLDTQQGLRQALALADRFTKGAIRVGSADGRLLHSVELRDVHYQTASGMQIDAGRLRLAWNPRELWQRRLHIELLIAENLSVTPSTEPAPKSAKSSALPARLPLDVVVDDAQLSHFQLGATNDQPFTLDAATARASWIGDRLEITRLDTALPQTGPLSLTASATMASDRIRFDHLDIHGPGEISAEGTFGLDEVASDLDLQWRDLRYPLIGDAEPAIGKLNGKLHFTGPLKSYRYTLHTEAVASTHPIILDSDGSGDLQALKLNAVKFASGPSTVDVQGSIGWSPVINADLALQFAHLNPALIDPQLSGELNGNAHAKTTVRAGVPDIGFDAQIDQSNIRGYPFSLKANGRSDTHSASFETLQIKAADGTIQAKGNVAWAPTLQASLDATITHLNPGVFAPRWSGDLNAKLHAEPKDIEGAPGTSFTANIDRSKLRDYPLTLTTAGDWHADILRLSQFAAASGASTLSLSGQLTPPFDAKGEFNSPELAQLYPNLSGQLKFNFSAMGALDDPHLLTQGSGKEIRYPGIHVATLSWNGDVDPKLPSKFTFNAEGIAAGLLISKASFTASGTEQYHHLEVHADTERGQIGAAVQGGYDASRQEWGGQLVSLNLTPASLPPWALEKAAGLLLGQQRLSLEPACLTGDGGRACFNLQQAVKQPGLMVAWNLEDVHLAAFKALLDKDSELTGRIDGTGHLQWLDGNIGDADADIRLTEAHFSTKGVPALDIQPSSIKLSQQNGALHGVLALPTNRGTVGADITAGAAASFGSRSLSGKISAAVPDLAFVQPFSPELLAVGGHIDGELTVAGTVSQPRIGGQLTLADGHAKLATPGIDLEDVAIKLSGNGEGPLAVTGSMRSDTGTLALAGTFDPSTAPPRFDLSLKGNDFRAAATRDAEVWISPDLKFLTDDSGAHLSGELQVPKARITPHGFGDSGVSSSSDQIIVGNEPVVEKKGGLPIFSTVKITLGSDVTFLGFGLKTRITGGTTIIEEPARTTRAQGELQLVDGSYKAYGQDLTIDDGRLIFNGGSVTAPTVDIRAYRKPAADIKVGVHVRGTLARPELTLESDPTMPREDQLSWLLLGRSLDNNSTSDRSFVSAAAMSLGVSGGDFLASRIGKKIGLDELSIGADTAGGSAVSADPTRIAGSQASQGQYGSSAASQAAQLTLGKYLTPKLFISYGVSLFQAGQTFRLLYDLGHGFKLQSESGVASGADLLYTIERGKK